jgi:CheY-like chemotaxis protein
LYRSLVSNTSFRKRQAGEKEVPQQLSSASLADFEPPSKIAEEKEKIVAIVDDNQAICTSVSSLIEHLGYRSPIVAHDGEEIVGAILDQGLTPNVIIMDYRLPRMDGLEASKRISKSRPDIKIVLATSEDNVRSEALSEGFEFLKKPFSLRALARTISS